MEIKIVMLDIHEEELKSGEHFNWFEVDYHLFINNERTEGRINLDYSKDKSILDMEEEILQRLRGE